MFFHEGTTRTRLEIFFETESDIFVGEGKVRNKFNWK